MLPPHSVIGMIESVQRQVTVPELISLAEATDADAVELLHAVLKEKVPCSDVESAKTLTVTLGYASQSPISGNG